MIAYVYLGCSALCGHRHTAEGPLPYEVERQLEKEAGEPGRTDALVESNDVYVPKPWKGQCGERERENSVNQDGWGRAPGRPENPKLRVVFGWRSDRDQQEAVWQVSPQKSKGRNQLRWLSLCQTADATKNIRPPPPLGRAAVPRDVLLVIGFWGVLTTGCITFQ